MSRTRLINKVQQILRRHNLQWELPTKTFPTVVALAWPKGLVLPEISPAGDISLPSPPTILANELRTPFDVAILLCKSYDLAGRSQV